MTRCKCGGAADLVPVYDRGEIYGYKVACQLCNRQTKVHYSSDDALIEWNKPGLEERVTALEERLARLERQIYAFDENRSQS